MSPLNNAQISILDSSVTAVAHHLDLRGLHGLRLFITGGTGFFGLWILSALQVLEKRHIANVEVTVLTRDPASFLFRYPQFRDLPWLKFLTGDVIDFCIPGENFDLVIHAATETSKAAHANHQKMLNDLIAGTRHTLSLAEKCNVKRVLLVSSGAVYGPQPEGEVFHFENATSACSPLLPESAYGEGKRVMELLGAIFQKETGVDTLVARCFAFCGPGLPINGHFAFGNFVRDALFGTQITVQGDGTPLRSYLFGADLAVWLLYLLIKGEKMRAYNVGSDSPISMEKLAFLVRDTLAPGKPVDILVKKKVDQPLISGASYVPAIAAARSLGCEIWTSLEESLQITARFLRS